MEEGCQDHLQQRLQSHGLSQGFPGVVEMTGGEKREKGDEAGQDTRQLIPGESIESLNEAGSEMGESCGTKLESRGPESGVPG